MVGLDPIDANVDRNVLCFYNQMLGCNMDVSRYTDWLLSYTLTQNPVFSAGGQHQQIFNFLDD